jgi:photosystem II stability/assembly factor-like uncharacterized protein
MKALLLTAVFFCNLFKVINPAFAQTWTNSNAPYPWTGIASSADGTIVVAVETNGPVILSTNSGINWSFDFNTPSSIDYKTAIACSANGTNIIIVGGYSSKGPIFTSPDFGKTWISNNVPKRHWTSVASSADGSELVAAATTNGVYVSTNSGVIWTLTSAPTNLYWNSVSCSADGSLMAAVATNYPVCVSTDAGNTWSTNSTFSSNSGDIVLSLKSLAGVGIGTSTVSNWQAIACSADKTKLLAAVYGGSIYLSTDSGTTWTSSTAPNANWQAVASSADGSKLAAVINNGPIYTSSDSGGTWTSNNAPNAKWVSISSSADGFKLVAAYRSSSGSALYTLQATPKSQLRLATTNSSLAFSWIKPSAAFFCSRTLI